MNSSEKPHEEVVELHATGRVKWFDKLRRYGFLTRDEPAKEDVLVHWTGIVHDPVTMPERVLEAGQRVSFQIWQSEKYGRIAKRVKLLK